MNERPEPPTEGSAPGEIVGFGPYRLLPKQRLLFEADRPLRLGSRAMEILIALVERGGEVVSQSELMTLVWPNIHVEETNLRVHIAALRKVLGDGQNGIRYIINSAGRGYTFVAPINRAASGDIAQPAPTVTEFGDLPTRAARLIGRTEFVEATARQIRQERLVTIVGPGGVGKTTVALAVAEKVKDLYEDGARFVDLSPIAEPRLTATALASVLGLSIASENPTQDVVRYLARRKMLIVLDTCEHLVDAAGTLVDELIRAAPGVHILATSREPLRTNSEWVRRLPPLALPEYAAPQDATSASGSPAVQLFLERVQASVDSFSATDRDIALAAELCRRLDGLPLAIELAAGRVEQFGLAGLLDRLGDNFAVLKDAMRSADPRHRTLRAMLDWSYNILPEVEQLVLRRVAPFKGEFTPESAAAVIGDPQIGEREVMEHLASLAGKSLVAANVSGEAPAYRLLDVNRAYALDKLRESGEAEPAFRRYCAHFCSLLQAMTATRKLGGGTERFAVYHRIVSDVRAALDWAFSPTGDTNLGIALTSAAVPLWFRLSLIDECRGRLERAIAALGTDQQGSREAMQLFAALGAAHMNTISVGPNLKNIWSTVLAIAEKLDDFDYRLRALWGLWVDRCNEGRYPEALTLAHRFKEAAAGSADPVDLAVSHRWIGVSLHYIGDQAAAKQHLERTLSFGAFDFGGADSMRFQYHQGIAARCYLGQIAFQQGFPDQAMGMVARNVDHAVSINHELSICFALTEAACPIALQVGDREAADRFTAMLLGLTERRALTGWNAMGRVFDAMARAGRGDIPGAVAIYRMALDDLRKARMAARFTWTLGHYAALLAQNGDITEAHEAIDEALQRSEANDERWCIAELLRIKGGIFARVGTATAQAAAERSFRQAIDAAQRQDSLMWELRAAIGLAELFRQQGRVADARERLAAIYHRFGEGFGRGDLKRAETLLKELA